MEKRKRLINTAVYIIDGQFVKRADAESLHPVWDATTKTLCSNIRLLALHAVLNASVLVNAYLREWVLGSVFSRSKPSIRESTQSRRRLNNISQNVSSSYYPLSRSTERVWSTERGWSIGRGWSIEREYSGVFRGLK